MKRYEIYCGGEFVKSAKELPVLNKYTGEVFATTYQADAGLLNMAIEKALKARPLCAGLSSLEKYTALKYISDELEKQKEDFAQLLCMESGKPMRYALAEIDRSVQTFLVAAEESKRLPKEYFSLDWTSAGKDREAIVKYFSAGVVAGIAPFNFPLNLAVHKLAPAIAAGCPTVLKPASLTPLSTLALAAIIDKSQLPAGAVSILPMDRPTGNLLVTDGRVDVLSFTGSPEIGWELKKQSGKKKVVLELGGNAAVIISEKADVTTLLDKCLVGAFSYSGQICIHAQRFFVHASLYDWFVESMKAATIKLSQGNPLDTGTDLSVMIDEENARRVESWVSEALDQGARLICGGKRSRSFFEPTILTNTNTSMKVNAEEIFGPVICIEKYSGEISQAIGLVNQSRYGLQCGVFTDSVSELDEVFNCAAVGGVIHNHVPTLRFDHMPYGGVKDSGLGREGIKYAIMELMEARVLVK